MKPIITPLFFIKIAILICTIFVFSFSSFAQNGKEVLTLLDTTDFKGKPLLNKTVRTAGFFDSFREGKKKVNANKEVLVDLPLSYLTNLYTILEQADLKDKPLPTKLKTVIGRKGKDVSENNAIPIGLINTDAWLLSQTQVEANINAKKANKKVNKRDYEIVNFIAAGLLQQEAYQSSVTFEIDPDLIVDNFAKNNAIKSLSFDFGDGKGFKDYDFKQQSIRYQFPRAGNYVIHLKLVTKQGTFISRNPFSVYFVNRPHVAYNGSVSTNVSTPTVKGARTTLSVSGADYAIHIGCDGIFDKPIIIAEGFDPDGSTDLNKLSASYLNAMEIFKNNGYDIVFVNYWNGTDWIQSNAQVLKRVIREINAKKIAHREENKLSIIGLSMSGLIARWALREMENEGENHEVARLICYDTPNKGANTPPGVSAMGWDSNVRGLQYGIMGELLRLLAPELKAFNSAASTQMLMFHTPTFSNQEVLPHPNYDAFYSALRALGNDGYPSQCKNIAFVNGALNGTFNTTTEGTAINPGDQIVDTDVHILWACHDYFNCYSNRINESTLVYDEDAFGVPLGCTNQEVRNYVNLPYNLDRLAGGFNSSSDPGYGFFIKTHMTPRFAFVPTFSAVDYKGSLVNDADYRLEIGSWLDANYQVRSDRQHLTPFRAIYGDSTNSEHVNAEYKVLVQIARREFGLNLDLAGCQACMGSGSGLKAQYYGDQDLQTDAQPVFTQPTINMKGDAWEYINGADLLANNISARWEGHVEAPITGTYTFNMRTDDGTRVWFNNQVVVDDWGYYPPTDHRFTVSLTAGQKYPIKIEWKQFGGGYEAKFLWGFNGVEEIVPSCYLYPLAYTSVTTGLTDGHCYTIQNKATNNYMQLMTDGTIQQQNANNGSNQRWRVLGLGISSVSSNKYITAEANSDGVRLKANGDSGDMWWRAVPHNGYLRIANMYGTTWDMEGSGSQPYLQLYGSVNDGFPDYRLWKFTDVGCSITGQGTSPTPTVVANQYTINPGQAATLTASGCSGTIVWEDNITSGNERNVYSAGTYSARCQNPGENISLAAFATINQNTTPPSNPCPQDEVVIGTLNGSEICIKHWGSYYLYCQKYNYNGVLTYTPRGANYLRDYGQNLVRNPNTEQFDACINVMETAWWGLESPLPATYTPAGWQEDSFPDGVGYFYQPSGARVATENSDVLKEGLVIIISPNPTGGKTTVSFELEQEQALSILLYDSQGKILTTYNVGGVAGKNQIPLDLSTFQSGVYLINVQTATERSTKRVIKIE